MKLKVFLAPMILTTALLLSSCIITSSLISVDISCDDFAQNPKIPNSIINEFEVEVGDKITLRLCSNRTTSYQWDYSMSVEDVLKLEDHDFEEPKSDAIGAAGIDIWTFEAAEKGTTVVSMGYSRPEQSSPEWTYTMTVTVE